MRSRCCPDDERDGFAADRRRPYGERDVAGARPGAGPFFHGIKADLSPGDPLAPGYGSDYGGRRQENFVHLAASLDAAVRGAELAVGEVVDREGHPPEVLQQMRDHLARLEAAGIEEVDE